MGRKTFESIGRALPNRRNIVISRNPEFQVAGCEVVKSIEEALQCVKDEEEVFIIGGGSIYREMWDRVDRLYITLVHAVVEGDTSIPAIDESKWKIVAQEKHQAGEKDDYDYSFIDYQRI